MEKKTKKVDRGKILHQTAKDHPNKIIDIVKAAGYEYGTFYKHIKNPNLPYNIIAKYGKAMKKDFSVEFPEMANLISFTISDIEDKQRTTEELLHEVQDIREKYTSFLEKHNALLEQNIALKEENARLREEISKFKSES